MARGKAFAGSPATSNYTGLRLTVTQIPGKGHMLLTVSTKHHAALWDEWQLLFPAARVPARRVDDHRDVLALVAEVVEQLLEG